MKRVVAALIFDATGRILICQRTASQSHPLKWELPGGKIEAGEEPRAALARELEEELGIEAEIAEEATAFEHHYPGGDAVALQFFAVRSHRGEVDNRIFADVRWIKLGELERYDLLEADRELVRKLAKGTLEISLSATGSPHQSQR